MARAQAPVYALNGGEVGKESVQRLDIDKMRFSGELYENIFPKVIGSFQFRGGFGYKADAPVNEADNIFLKFIFGSSQNALLHFSSDGMRIFDADSDSYLTRAAVSTTISEGDFDAQGEWTDESDAGATAVISGGNCTLTGASGSEASIEQDIAVSGTDDTTEHALEIEVLAGPVGLSIGTTSGGEEILGYTGLEEGFHSLAFTPGDGVSTVYIRLTNAEEKEAVVTKCDIAPSGTIVVEHPWATADLRGLNYAQSSDVIFVASDGTYQQRRIERRSTTSWSVVRYKVDDGPFDILPDESVSLTSDGLSGNVTLTADTPIFSEDDVGSLFRLVHYSQFVEASFTAAAQTSNNIVVTGSGGNDRRFDYAITGTWVGSVAIDRAIGNDVSFSRYVTYTANITDDLNDGLDNSTVYYRWRAVDITSGQADVELDFEGGVTYGVLRITAYTDESTLEAEVLSPIAETDSTTQWDRGTWSDRNGWPSSVTFFDGRLWWGRGGVVYGSTSDAFDVYDDLSEDDAGDSAPVVRSIGTDTSQGVLWLLGLQRLIAGTDTAEISIRASSFDEPITASSFVPRVASTRGSVDVQAVQVDSEGIYVQRSNARAYRFAFDSGRNDYFSFELTKLHREIIEDGVVKMDVQRHPDTRVWFLLETGEARVLTLEVEEGVVAWSRVTTENGIVEDIAVLPSAGEDRVFAIVKRTIDSSEVRYIEELAPLSESIGSAHNCMADSYVKGTQVASTTISGLDHLEGEEVVVWADGASLHNQDNMMTVSGGEITVSEAVTDYVVGLAYSGYWTSTDLAYGSDLGTALTQRKRVSHLGLVMNDVALDGLRIGKSFDDRDLRRIRQEKGGKQIDGGEVLAKYNYDATSFPGGWDTESRVNIQMKAPYPATISAMVLSMKTKDMAG